MPSKKGEQLVGAFPYLPKQDRARAKRDALLKSGRELFIQKGYELTTAKDVAAHAGVATGTFYRYFQDKRQLLMALLEDKLDKFIPPEPDWAKRDHVSYLAFMLEAHFEELDNLGLHRVFVELLPHDSELASVMERVRVNLHARIVNGLQRTKQEGHVWNDLDLETLAWSILVLIENAQRIKGKNEDFLELAKVICRIASPPATQQTMKKTKEK